MHWNSYILYRDKAADPKLEFLGNVISTAEHNCSYALRSSTQASGNLSRVTGINRSDLNGKYNSVDTEHTEPLLFPTTSPIQNMQNKQEQKVASDLPKEATLIREW